MGIYMYGGGQWPIPRPAPYFFYISDKKLAEGLAM